VVRVCKLGAEHTGAVVSAAVGDADDAVFDDDEHAAKSNADAAMIAAPNRRVDAFFTLSP
jgi:class 3 adenylate cyclase